MQRFSFISNQKNNKKSPNLVFTQARQSLFFKPIIQPKLTVNQPNDEYEQEADAVADKVMRMPDPVVGDNLFFKPVITSVQRKCAHCEEEEEKKMQQKEINSEAIVSKVDQTNIFSGTNLIQPKLTINQPNDVYEQEANVMADKVMRMTNASINNSSFFKPANTSVQRKSAHYEEEEKKMQRKEAINNETHANSSIENYIGSLNGKGRLLSKEERSFFEPRFDYDFSNVQLHTNTEANQSAQSINALAYTSGNNIVFNEGQYAPDTDKGKRLLGHELAHTIQQGASVATPTPCIQRQGDKRLEEIKEKLRKGEKLTEEEIAYVKAQLGKEIVQQVLGGVGQINIDFDSSREPQDINRRFQGKLQLRLTGAIGAVAKSLEGVATADIDLVATLATEKAVITIAPPIESNRMAALIREQLFPNGNVRSFDFNFPKSYFKYAGAVSLISGITVSITGTNGKHTEGMILINHESVPNDVELIVTLSPSFRSTGVAETERKLPNDHWILTPKPDIFGTIGYAGADKSNAFTSTLGADVPLGYDTKNPFIYAGLGARASLDTNRLARVGGTGFLGLNLNPLTLQLGFGAGAAFLREPVITNDGPAQTVFYSEVEGKVAYRIVPHVELLTIFSVGGGKNLPAYGTAQAGVGYAF